MHFPAAFMTTCAHYPTKETGFQQDYDCFLPDRMNALTHPGEWRGLVNQSAGFTPL